MKKKILILNDEQYQIEEVLKSIQIEISDIEIIEASLEELKLFKNILNRNNETTYTIRKILDLLGVPNDKIGYKYIVDAILLWNKYQEMNNFNISHIYKKIGIVYNKSLLSIEKAIRNCIEYTFTYGNLERLNQFFHTNISLYTGKINNKKFIVQMANYIKDQNNEKK